MCYCHHAKSRGWSQIPAWLIACLCVLGGWALPGCDSDYNQRKAQLWLDEINALEKKSANTDPMNRFVANQQILDRCKQLLDANVVTGQQRTDVINRYVQASLELGAKGDRASYDDLTKFCLSLKGESDPQIRKICDLGVVELEALMLFENQRIRNHIDELALISQRSDLGDSGAKFAELTGKIKDLWSDTEKNGTDHAEELERSIRDLEGVVVNIPIWAAGPREVEIRYNQLRAHYLDNSLAKNIDYANLFSEAEKLAAANPANAQIAAKVGTIVDRLVTTNQIGKALEFGKQILPVYAQATDPAIVAVRQRIQQQMTLCQAGIEKTIHDWSKNPDLLNEAGLAELGKQLEQLQGGSDLGAYAAERLALLLATAEATHNTANANQAVSLVKTALGSNPAIGAQVTQSCDAAAKRLSLVGQKFELPKAAAVQGEITPENIAGKWVMVTFYRAGQVQSVNVLDEFEQFEEAPAFRKLLPQRLGLSIDDQLDDAKKQSEIFKYDWPLLLPAALENGKNPYAEQYGVDKSPYCLLVNPDGVVEMVGMSSHEVIGRLMDKVDD